MRYKTRIIQLPEPSVIEFTKRAPAYSIGNCKYPTLENIVALIYLLILFGI